jgi:hypothetical protein
MSAFKSNRVVHEFTQTNPATPERVFPLLCPVRETDWLPGWEYQLIHSDSGVAELGCVFTTPNGDSKGNPTQRVWIATEYDPKAFRIAYVWFDSGVMVSHLEIRLTAAGSNSTHTHIRRTYTTLSPEGNRELEKYDKAWFEVGMRRWENSINHYLTTGEKLAA